VVVAGAVTGGAIVFWAAGFDPLRSRRSQPPPQALR
jgi:hypothetical protein